jgi:GNAT superfamily N-acetyltransferase
MAISDLILGARASLTPSELADADALVREARWNQTIADWRVFIRHGHLYAAQTSAGRIVATTATLPFGGRFAWISMVLVTGDYRRQGLATQLLRLAMADLAVQRLVPVLDATPDGRPVYRRLGFEDCWGFQRLVRQERRPVLPAALADEASGQRGDSALRAPTDVTIRAITEADWRALCAYDAAAFGAERSAVLDGLRGRLPPAELIAERNGRIVGFSLGRDGGLAPHIGPLSADDDTIACALAARALDTIEGRVFIDLADVKTELRTFLDAYGFAVARPFTRMAFGSSVRFDDAARTFAVAGPEYG